MSVLSPQRHFFSRRKALPYLLLAPIIIFVALLMLYPMVNVYVMSLQNYKILKPKERAFIGLQNYINIFTNDPLFWKALRNSGIWILFSVVFQTSFGFGRAMLLNTTFRGRGLYRALVLSPWAVSGVMVGIIWSLIYGETYGVLNDVLKNLGLIQRKFSWFSSAQQSMTAIIIANIWRGVPFFCLNYLSALTSINSDIYESAKIDGANGAVTLFRITIPMIKDTIILTTLLRSIWTFNAVDLIYSLTYGGPNNGTTTMPLYIMTTFKTGLDYGYASALAGISTIIMMIFAGVYIKLGKLGKEGMY